MPRGANPNSLKNLTNQGKGFGSTELAQKAQKKSAKKRKENKEKAQTFRDAFQALLDGDITDKNGQVMTGREAIALSLFKEAITGKSKTKSAELIIAMMGEKPAEKVVVSEVDTNTIDEVKKMIAKANENNGV